MLEKTKEFIYGSLGYNGLLELEGMQTKLVAGTLFRVTMRGADGTLFEVELLSQPWMAGENGEDALRVVNHNIIEKEEEAGSVLGGWEEFGQDNLTEEFVNEILEEAKEFVYMVTGFNGALDV